MTGILKALFLFLLILIYILVALLAHFLITFIKPCRRYSLISRCTKIFNLCFRKILGIKLYLEGETAYLKESGNFIISNHLSYLDGIILASLFPIIFVSKLQVKGWPFFGWMTRVSGTIFIDRKRKLKAMDSIDEISNVLKNKANVLLFPEGTSTNGEKVLPFQSLFFEAALKACSPIVPVTIQYLKIDSQNLSLENRDKIFWYGQVKFLKHVFFVLRLSKIEARVSIHPKIQTGLTPHKPYLRKELSEISHQVILKDFSAVT